MNQFNQLNKSLPFLPTKNVQTQSSKGTNTDVIFLWESRFLAIWKSNFAISDLICLISSFFLPVIKIFRQTFYFEHSIGAIILRWNIFYFKHLDVFVILHIMMYFLLIFDKLMCFYFQHIDEFSWFRQIDEFSWFRQIDAFLFLDVMFRHIIVISS